MSVLMTILQNTTIEKAQNPNRDIISRYDDIMKEISILNFDVHEDAERYMIIESVTNSSSKTIHEVNFSN